MENMESIKLEGVIANNKHQHVASHRVTSEGILEEYKNLAERIGGKFKKRFKESKDRFNDKTMDQSMFEISKEFIIKSRLKIGRVEADIYSFLKKFGIPFTIDFSFLFDLFFGIYRLVRYDNKIDIFMTLMFIVKTFMGSKFKLCKDIIYNWLNVFVLQLKSFGRLQSQSVPEWTGEFEFKRMFDMIMSSNLIVSIQTLVLNLVGAKFFDRKIVDRFMNNHLGVPCAASLMECMRNIIEVTEEMISFGVHFARTGSFIEALSAKDPVSGFLEGTYSLTLQYKSVYIGDSMNFPDAEAEGRIAAKDFLVELREQILRGQNISKKMKVNTAFKARLYLLHEIYNELYHRMRSKDRRAPFGVVIYGDPSIGKSSLLVHIYKLFCKHKGLEYSHDLVYNRNPKSKHWTDHDPLTQPIIHYPELGSIHKDIAKTKGDETMDEMLCVADTQPYSAEMADIEDKGKVMVMPDLLVIDCNDPEMNAKYLVNNPAAIKRRFLYVKAVVKKEYRMDNGSGLDTSKIPDDLEDKMDLWLFKVYRQQPVNLRESVPVHYEVEGGEDFGIFTFSDLLLRLFKEHDEIQDSFGKATKEDVSKYVGKSVLSESQTMPEKLFDLYWWILFPINMFSYTFTFLYCGFCFKKLYANYMGQPFPFLKWIELTFLRITTDILVKDAIAKWWNFITIEFCLGCDFMWFFGRSFFVKDNLYEEHKFRVQNSSGILRFSIDVFLFSLAIAAVKIFLSLLDLFHTITSEGNIIDSSGAYSEENVDETINEVEEKSGCGFPEAKKKTHSDKDYDKVENFFPRLVSDQKTYNKFEEVNNTILRNMRYLKISYDGKNLPSMGLGVCKDYMLVNKHVIHPGGEMLVSKQSYESALVGMKISDYSVVDVADDVALIRVHGCLFKDIRAYFFNLRQLNHSVDALFCGKPLKASKSKRSYTISNNFTGSYPVTGPYEYSYPRHFNGLCGSPLVIKYENQTFVAAIHTGAVTDNPQCYGAAVYLDDLNKAIDSLEKEFLLSINSEGTFNITKGKHLDDVTKRSPILYEHCPGINVAGSISDYKPIVPNSTLKRSPLEEKDIEKMVGLSPRGANGKLLFYPPQMRSKIVNGEYIAPYNGWIRKVGVLKSSLDEKMMKTVSAGLTAYIVSSLHKVGVHELRPFKLSIAQNGYPENFYIRAMKNSTSGGFLLPGKKSLYNREVELEFKQDAVMPEFEVKEQVLEILRSYEHGEMSHSIVGAQLKDEPRSYEKVKAGKTRVFAMSSYDMTLVNRMYLMPFYALMCEHRDLFCTKVGINMHSSEAQEMYFKLRDFSPNIMEGDYGGYDTSMPVGVGEIANTVVYRVLEKLGYNDFSLKIVKGILSDNLYPTIAMEGNLFVAPGFQPSGKYATAEDNSLRGLILLYYAYLVMCTKIGEGDKSNFTTQFEVGDFFKLLLPVTYGDDMLCAVKEELAPYFNNITYAEFVEKVYGMEFTTADKKAHSARFVDITKISFLKRTFQYNSLLDRYVAVLDKESLLKSLLYVLPSKQVSMYTQTVETMNAALRELFFYCTSIQEYDDLRKLFIEVAVERTRFVHKDLEGYFPLGDDLHLQYA